MAMTWEVIVPDTMGGDRVVHRGEDKAEALRVKASFSKDAAFTKVTVKEIKENEQHEDES